MSRMNALWGAAALALIALAPVSFGQALSGTLTGTVADSTGSVVPKANITVRNAASGDVRKTITNNEGYFTVAALAAGTYSVSVDAPGFQKYEARDLAFNPGDKRNLDVVLQVGTATQTVEVVSAQDTVTPVDSGEKSSVLTTKELQNISVIGRSAAEFIKILPGMAQTGSGVDNRPGFSGEVIGINGNGDGGHQSALGYFSANGTPTNSMDITADGSHVSDPGCNCATPVNPNTDMIQEFKVQTSNFSAENSKGPVVLNSISKAGTTNFHGEGYFYARHSALNSNDWLSNAFGIAKPNNKYFFPGGNIGGPVLIPGTRFNKNRDKLFFFTGYEYFYQDIDTGVLTASVPTDAMRNGDFSPASIAALGANAPGSPGQITDPKFPGGIIPKSSFDPGGLALINLYPKANANPAQTGGSNYVNNLLLNQNSYQWLTRVDYSISDNTKLFVRYNLQNELQQFPVSLWWRPQQQDQVPYPTPIDAHNTSKSISASLTHVFSPSLTNEFVFGYTYINFPNSFADPQKVDRTALGYPYQGIFKNGIKQIPSVTAWGNEVAWLWNPGGFEFANGNLFATKYLNNYADNLSKVWGTHTAKFGAFYEHVINNQPSNNFSNGEFNFSKTSPISSGNAYADMLLGRASSFDQQNFNVLHNEAYNIFEFYAQDSWKVTRRLTVDYGMRFQHLGNWLDRQGLGFAVWTPSTFVNDKAAFLPGISWNKRDSSIPLSGFPSRKLFYAPRFGMAWDVFGSGKTVLRGGWGAYRFHTAQSTDGLDAPTGSYSQSIASPMTFAQIEQLTPAALSTYQSGQLVLDRNDDQQPLTYSYSFTISQRMIGSSVLELSYVGNQTKYLYENAYHNINAVPYGTLLNVPDANSANYNLFRPNQYYQDLKIGRNDAYSNYNGFQASWNRQRGRVGYLLNYTYSKALGINSGSGLGGNNANTLDINQNYGPLSFDRRHLFNAAYSIELPSPIQHHAILEGVVNGWQISGITQFQSGVNLQQNNGSVNFNLNPPAGTLPGGNNLSARTVAGTESVSLMPLVTCNPTANLREHQFINGACFALPGPGNNGPYVMPEMFGPAFFNSDLSLFKNFVFSESRKLQFRFSGYNFMNHPLYSFGHDNNLNLSFGADGKVNNSNFGLVTNKVGRRVIQLAVKFYF
jgi:hypothetical protein